MGVNRINFRDPGIQRSGSGRFLVHIALLLAFIWLLGFLSFTAAIPRAVRDVTTRADAIVVLTGGRDRLAEAFRLLEAGLAPRLLITGVAQGVSLTQVIDGLGEDRDAAPSAALQACCITLGYEAGNTVGNAAESAAWVEANNVRSVRLVTANYHIQRSRLEFRRTLPEIELILNPVYPPEVQDGFWFVKPRILGLLIGEYHKFIGAWMRAVSHDALIWANDGAQSIRDMTGDWSLPDWADLFGSDSA
ncbi:YdcF family protein [Dongia sp.]|uniref:YdcF family protein n=1 Tax=Dongia sp. TaxID=1977262 RepID=UPI0035B4F2C1